MFNPNLHKLDVFVASFDDDGAIPGSARSKFLQPPRPYIPMSDLKPAELSRAVHADAAQLQSPWYRLNLDSRRAIDVPQCTRNAKRHHIAVLLPSWFYCLIPCSGGHRPADPEFTRPGRMPAFGLFNVSLEGFDRIHQDEDCWVHDLDERAIDLRKGKMQYSFILR